jgi:Nif-specific regulatory protein
MIGVSERFARTWVGASYNVLDRPLQRRTPMSDRDSAETRLRRERDLYLGLLQLGRAAEVESFLQQALSLIVEATGARRGYLEIRDEESGGDTSWWIAHDCSSEQVEHIRASVSRGIVGQALATGRTVVTPSALLDPRFRERESVQLRGTQAVLCAPVGNDPPLGVLYLEERPQHGAFSREDCLLAETFAAHLAPFADRLLVRRRSTSADLLRPLREKLRLDGVVGRSRALVDVLQQAALIAPLDVPVLLTGESGTGKSQLARVIHDSGPRAGGPFVELSCAALPENLIENELFGAEVGGHSTAARPIRGKLEASEGGTLFLDEIGELALAAQAKLLQLLQSRVYYPLGGSRPRHTDIRVIAATNTDLESAIAAGRFREDLLYRLQVLPLRVPSLAERREDVAELASWFCRESVRRHRLPALELSRGAIAAIEAAEWPGNVRQLANAVEASAIRAVGSGATRIEMRHVFPESPAAAESDGPDTTFQEATRRFQRELLVRTLEETAWNVSEAARRLDLARSHVYNLIKALGITKLED